ncbi:MAG: phosphomethylpyrimidine synthase ThiC [Candidatus Glassbacteria bacterium]|nr:phosphomethylpyrimidine synthase ThiC [Candidatus Glassbacteria bacterium]
MEKRWDFSVPEEMIRQAAVNEPLDAKQLADSLARGRTVVLGNRLRDGIVRPTAVGENTRTKVNANFGTSRDAGTPEEELCKLRAAIEAGADAVMDLSTGPDLERMLKLTLEKSEVPVGTVPIYKLAVEVVERGCSFDAVSEEDFIEVVREHCRLGADFITVHCGLTREGVRQIDMQGRVTGIVSRGGSFLYRWMRATGLENPLYTYYDEILKISAEYNVTLSLGDGLRPGSIADATDRGQVAELMVLGELVQRAREAGVQSMVEGPGHVPLDQVRLNIELEKRLCDGAPFYVLGPLVTDIAPGYDHLTSAIGGAVAGAAGADFLCYVTPAEHLRLPTLEDVRTGVICCRIAAHAADLAKGLPGAADWDRAMSTARKALDWEKMYELAIDPELARTMRAMSRPADENLCTMCSELCALKE